jgi:prepilin-type N-terminal cleavage/methylation domain-containing protein
MHNEARPIGGQAAGRRYGTLTTRRTGFTLIELLVVVSIIALLISILLPSLQAAREQAKTLKCSANIKGIVGAALTYATENSDWMPGSPGTTGSILFGIKPSPPQDAETIGGGTWGPAAVQTWDWAGPLAAVQMKQPITGNRPAKFRKLVETIFACPSNKILSLPFFGSPPPGPHGNFDVQKMVSYNTCRNFLMWPRSRGPNGEQPWGAPAPRGASWDQLGGTTYVPRGYQPQIDRVGTASEKGYIADGSRYTSGDVVDFDISWDASAGGAFSSNSPVLHESFLRSYMTIGVAKKYSYRHGQGSRVGIVVGFFDGHAEFMSEPRSRTPEYWFPKGTLVRGIAAQFNRPTRARLVGAPDDYWIRR